MAEIEENENNSYAQNDIDELAESINVIGLQQTLVVRRKTEGGYFLLAGHRRRNALALLDRKAAPCIVLDADLDPSIQTLILHWTNTMARGGAGLTAEYTGQAAKEIEAALKDLQARGVVELPGKLRSYVAEVLKTSEERQYLKRLIRRHNRQIHKMKILKGGKKKNNQAPFEVFGFRLFDKVLYNNKIFFVYGRRKSGSFNIRDFNGENSKDVSRKKFKLIRGKRHPIILK